MSRVSRFQSPQGLHQEFSGLTSAEAHDTRPDQNTGLATRSRRGREITIDLSSSELIKTETKKLNKPFSVDAYNQTGRGGINTAHFLL
jgi:hypothetical protein